MARDRKKPDVIWISLSDKKRIDRPDKLDVIVSVRAQDGGAPVPDSGLHPCSRCRHMCWVSPRTKQVIKEYPAAPFFCIQCAEEYAASLKPH